MKFCNKCKTLKKEIEFHKRGNKLQSRCKSCARVWVINNRGKTRAAYRIRVALDPDKARARWRADARKRKERMKAIGQFLIRSKKKTHSNLVIKEPYLKKTSFNPFPNNNDLLVLPFGKTTIGDRYG